MIQGPSVLALVLHLVWLSFVDSILLGVDLNQFASFMKPEIRVVGLGIVELNPDTFSDFVSDDVETDWVVLFCRKGDTTCDETLPSYERICLRQIDSVNDRASSGSRRVRFGKVECSRDPGLCTEQGVNSFATVAHYVQGHPRGSWTSGGRQGLLPWLVRSFAGHDCDVGCDGREFGQNKGRGRPIGNREVGVRDLSGVNVEREGRGEASGTLRQSLSLAAPMCNMNYLKRLQDSVLMTDCIFARCISVLLILLIFGKCLWIIFTEGVDIGFILRRLLRGCGLTPSSGHFMPVDRSQASPLPVRIVLHI
eukprot:TRINITY_DN69964_c0_g1_i1.p1 TRINITY_DN69964_c0_g1~~TRINITY_DN69964_c0_g1_i1.p1  ORF type:complete len:358 (-),score=36.00 TRINITY_DN69964_c0_g1_i1:221-1147(-)